MGDKAKARETMEKAKVPIIPGSEGAIHDEKMPFKLLKRLVSQLSLKLYQAAEVGV